MVSWNRGYAREWLGFGQQRVVWLPSRSGVHLRRVGSAPAGGNSCSARLPLAGPIRKQPYLHVVCRKLNRSLFGGAMAAEAARGRVQPRFSPVTEPQEPFRKTARVEQDAEPKPLRPGPNCHANVRTTSDTARRWRNRRRTHSSRRIPNCPPCHGRDLLTRLPTMPAGVVHGQWTAKTPSVIDPRAS